MLNFVDLNPDWPMHSITLQFSGVKRKVLATCKLYELSNSQFCGGSNMFILHDRVDNFPSMPFRKGATQCISDAYFLKENQFGCWQSRGQKWSQDVSCVASSCVRLMRQKHRVHQWHVTNQTHAQMRRYPVQPRGGQQICSDVLATSCANWFHFSAKSY